MNPEDGQHCLLVFGHGRREGLCCRLRDAIMEIAASLGCDLRLHDLLEDGFDPVLRLEAGQPHATMPREDQDALAHRYAEDVMWADLIIVLHPVWWFAVPAILKGWVDRILVQDVALVQPDDGPPRGLLQGRGMILVQTFGTGKLIERTVFRSLARRWWKHAVVLPTGLKLRASLSLHDTESLEERDVLAFEERIRQALQSALQRQP